VTDKVVPEKKEKFDHLSEMEKAEKYAKLCRMLADVKDIAITELADYEFAAKLRDLAMSIRPVCPTCGAKIGITGLTE